MRNAIVILAVLLLVLVVIWAVSGRRRKTESDDSFIQLCILLSGPIEFDAPGFMRSFQEQWGGRVACDENPQWADPESQSKTYLATDGESHLLITASGRPIPEELVKITLETAINLSEEQTASVRDHRAHMRVRYFTGSQDPVKRVEFSAKALLLLLESYPAVGYVNMSGQLYQPKEQAHVFFEEKSLEPGALFLLFTSVQVVTNGETDMHTHGLEQFGLPDIRIKYRETEKREYYYDLLANAVVYCIQRGPILKPGHTAELAGDGVIYRIKDVPRAEKRHFGHLGAIEIARA